MTLCIKITRGPNEGARFTTTSKNIRVGSDPGNEIRLEGIGIPKIAFVLEYYAPAKGYRIHDRSHGKLRLDGRPVSEGKPTIWEHAKELSIEDHISLLLEDSERSLDDTANRPPSVSSIAESSRIQSPPPKVVPSPRLPKPIVEQVEKRDVERNESPRNDSIRLTTKSSSKNKGLEYLQIAFITLVTGLICWSILYFDSSARGTDDHHVIRYDALAEKLWEAVRDGTLPQKYMETLTQGRVNEKKDPQRVLNSYIELKQELLSNKKSNPKKSAPESSGELEKNLLDYINQRIGGLQRELTKKKR